jgi:hypothetical protein
MNKRLTGSSRDAYAVGVLSPVAVGGLVQVTFKATAAVHSRDHLHRDEHQLKQSGGNADAYVIRTGVVRTDASNYCHPRKTLSAEGPQRRNRRTKKRFQIKSANPCACESDVKPAAPVAPPRLIVTILPCATSNSASVLERVDNDLKAAVIG